MAEFHVVPLARLITGVEKNVACTSAPFALLTRISPRVWFFDGKANKYVPAANVRPGTPTGPLKVRK